MREREVLEGVRAFLAWLVVASLAGAVAELAERRPRAKGIAARRRLAAALAEAVPPLGPWKEAPKKKSRRA